MFSGQVEINAGDGARKPAHHAFAERIWREAAPIGDTLAKASLEARGIRAVSRALRFHPRPPLCPRGNTQSLPAIIASVTMSHGLVAVHRPLLDPLWPAVPPFTNPQRVPGRLDPGAFSLF